MSIMGADIGRNTAIAVIDIDANLDIVDVRTCFLDMNTVYGDQVDKRDALYNMTYTLVRNEQPFAFGLESPFMSRFPRAFGLLSEFISTMEMASNKANRNTITFRVSPREGKKAVDASDDSKDAMFNALIDIEELEPFIHNNLNEHEIDSIAIAYFMLQRYRKEPGLYIIDRYNK